MRVWRGYSTITLTYWMEGTRLPLSAPGGRAGRRVINSRYDDINYVRGILMYLDSLVPEVR